MELIVEFLHLIHSTKQKTKGKKAQSVLKNRMQLFGKVTLGRISAIPRTKCQVCG